MAPPAGVRRGRGARHGTRPAIAPLLAAATCAACLPPASSFKVIGVGYPRTGIRSLDVALEKLGYNPYRMGHVDHLDKVGHRNDLQDWVSIINGTAHAMEDLTERLLAKGYDSILDVPLHVTDVSLRLVELFPDAQVILSTHPDSAAWFKSFMFHMREFDHSSAKWSPMRAVVMNKRAHALRKVHNADLKKMKLPFVPRDSDADAFIAVYEQHNEDIRQAVHAGRLLEFEARSGWEPLCQFLDKPLPSEPYPHLLTLQDEMMHVKAQEDYIFKFEMWLLLFPTMFLASLAKYFYDKFHAKQKVLIDKANV